MKKLRLIQTAFLLVMVSALVSCGGVANGPAEKVLSKKVFSQVQNEYDCVLDFTEGLCPVGKGSWSDVKWGAIDKKGKVVIPLEYDGLSNFKEGVALFKNKVNDETLIGLIDKNGKIIVPATYVDAGSFVNGLCPVATKDPSGVGILNMLWGYINNNGEIIIPINYNYADDFNEDLACVKKGEKYGYINNKGETIIPFNYDGANPFSEKLAIVEKGEKEMVIDKKGEVVYVLPDNQAFPLLPLYNSGLVPVKKLFGDSWWDDENIRCGYLNTKGEVAIDFNYDDVENFENGIAQVKKGSRTLYINTKGEEVDDPDLD